MTTPQGAILEPITSPKQMNRNQTKDSLLSRDSQATPININSEDGSKFKM
jgi:hypothetical protein